MNGTEITQKVIDFQYSRIQIKDQCHNNYYSDDRNQIHRFTQWNLHSIIYSLGLGEKNQFSIKWVGFDQTSYLDAFLYCLFTGSRSTLSEKDMFIKLKYYIYQLAAKFLKMGEQKKIVEALCSANYAKDLAHFLRKNKFIYNLFQQLLKAYLDSIKSSTDSELEELKLFAKIFKFIKFEVIKDSIGLFIHQNQKFFIICEKGCYFIVEVQQKSRNETESKRFTEKQEESEPESKREKAKQQDLQMKIRKMREREEGVINLKRFKEEESQRRQKKHKINQKIEKKAYVESNSQVAKLEGEERKFLQYATPEFLLKGLCKKDKSQKNIEGKSIKDELEFNLKNVSHNKARNPEPILTKRQKITNKQELAVQNENKIVRNTMHSPNYTSYESPQRIPSKSKSKCKSKQKQKTNYGMFYKLPKKRIKTGIIQGSSNQGVRSSKPKSNEITFDEKQRKKISLKKIQLSLKQLTDQKLKDLINHRNSYTELPKMEVAQQFEKKITLTSPGSPQGKKNNFPFQNIQAFKG